MSERRLPRVTVAEVQRALLRAGWRLKREGGNHQIWSHQVRGGRVVMPRHTTQTLKPKTLRSILDQASLTVEEFRRLL